MIHDLVYLLMKPIPKQYIFSFISSNLIHNSYINSAILNTSTKN